MLHILEGCDATGKTTYANELKEQLEQKGKHVTLIHFGAEVASNPEAFRLFCSIIEKSKSAEIIADRFMHGQFVYQGKNERSLSYNQLSVLELKLMEAGGQVYLFESPVAEIEERMHQRGEEVNTGEIERIMARYRELFRKKSILCPKVITVTKAGGRKECTL